MYHITMSAADAPRNFVWTARTTDGTYMSSLVIDGTTQEIQWIGTAPRYRRQGIATALLARAKRDGFRPVHSQHRTPDGELWARSTGDPLPRNAVLA